MCQCGCGELAPIAGKTRSKEGAVKGQPVRFISGHNMNTPEQKEISRRAATKHGHYRSPTYYSWETMRRRCQNPNNNRFYLYGARGISVCERWASFENFLQDMGERPEGKTLDRIDSEGNYEPGNCRWATPAEQAENRAPKGSRLHA